MKPGHVVSGNAGRANGRSLWKSRWTSCIKRPVVQAALSEPPTATDVATVKRLAGCHVLRGSPAHQIVPILLPSHDGLPFAMSLEMQSCPAAAPCPSPAAPTLPGSMYELFYFLEGQGSVTVAGQIEAEPVKAGDSVMAAAGRITVACGGGAGPEGGFASQLSYLRLLLPREFMLAAGDQQLLRHSCELATEATSHWLSEDTLQMSAPQLQHLLSAAKRSARGILFNDDPAHPDGATLSAASDAPLTPPARAPAFTASGAADRRTLLATSHIERAASASHADSTHGGEVNADYYENANRAGSTGPRLASAWGRSAPANRVHASGRAAERSDSEGSSSGSESGGDARRAVSEAHVVAFLDDDDDAGGAAAAPRGGAGVLSRAARALDAAVAAVRAALPHGECPFTKISVGEAPSYRLPNQDNRLALMVDPRRERVPFTFGVEIFPPGHETPPHVHTTAYELFFIVAGEGEAFCNGARFPVRSGDTVVFPPGCVHGIDAGAGGRMYCLELMLPNEMFAEMVRAGTRMDSLDGDDMCVLASVGCR